MKIIIAGSRDFTDYEVLKQKLAFLLKGVAKVEIVSGAARGADRLGERFAREMKYPLHQFKADWDRFGQSAGYRRNEVMAQSADALVAFWDGQSRGTKHMIDLALKQGLNVRIVRF